MNHGHPYRPWRTDTANEAYQAGYDAGEATGDTPCPATDDVNYRAGFSDGRHARQARAARSANR